MILFMHDSPKFGTKLLKEINIYLHIKSLYNNDV